MMTKRLLFLFVLLPLSVLADRGTVVSKGAGQAELQSGVPGVLECCCDVNGPEVSETMCAQTTGYAACSELNGVALFGPEGFIGMMSNCSGSTESE